MKDIGARIIQSINNYPVNTAIISSKLTLSYTEMNNYIGLYVEKINEICHNQIRNNYVLIYISSPLEAIIAQIAIIISGGICIPLDRETPLAYYSLEHIKDIACIITDDYEFLEQVDFPVLRIIEIEKSILTQKNMNVNCAVNSLSENVYCIMTSGTTGTPKAVVLKQEAVINQVDAKIALLDMNYNSRVCLCMNLSFVASIWQVLGTFFVGGSLVLLDDQVRHNPYNIFEKANESASSILCVAPSVFRAFLLMNKSSRKISLDNLLNIVLTGELLFSDLVKEFYEEYNIPLINAYGQTECSDDTFHYIIPRQFDYINNPIIPIGYPIPNIDFIIIDESGNEVERGAKGELCIFGQCLSPGYIQNNERNQKMFRSLHALSGASVFCTGDLVSQLNNDMLICYGRKDNKVKINGYRIEPESIEASSLNFKGIHDVLVLKIETPTDGYLHLQYVPEKGVEIDARELRKHLFERLPPYMMPAIITKTRDIKYSNNGKKIRNISVLMEMKADKMDKRDTVITKEVMYQLVLGLLRKVLKRTVDSSLSMDDDFFVVLSVNSLEFVSLIVEIETVLNIEFDLDKFVMHAFPTLSKFLDYLLEAYENTPEE